MTAPTPLTDTDAALTRIQAIARLAGIALRVYEHWATCTCTTGTHPYMKRTDAANEADARAWTATEWSVRYGRHVVRNHRLDGYTAWEETP